MKRFEYEPSDEYTFLGQLLPDDTGDWVRHADVADAWSAKLASIRAAVEAERSAALDTLCTCPAIPHWADCGVGRAMAALGALLAVAP